MFRDRFLAIFPSPRMEKNALRAMEAGGRTSVAAAYEAMAAKEAGAEICHGGVFFLANKKMLRFVENVEIHGIWYDFMEFSWDFIGFHGISFNQT